MNSDDIIRMAKEANVWVAGQEPYQTQLERFAALVAAAEREAMEDIILDYAGRDDLSDSDESLLKHLLELIRARGEQ